MNITLVETVLTALYLLIGAYVGWVHRRQTKLEDRVGTVEREIAGLSDVKQILRDMDRKLDDVTRAVYMVAGKEGISLG